jgi:hypothetical protein
MNNPDDLKKIFIQSGAIILQTYESNQTQANGDATPSQLIEAISQFFIIYEKLGHQYNENSLLKKENISQIGEEAISCLSELGKWAERLDLPREKSMLEEIALSAAHWVIRHHGEIRSLDIIVDLLAAKANHCSDKEVLTSLFHVMKDVIVNAMSEYQDDLDKTNPARPWRMLNFNFAIVATRTLNKDLMVTAFDTLGRHLPEDCPQFFEEGLRQSEKSVYGPEIQAIMSEYFKKWATLH